jgi:hypothetical protein
MTLCGCDPNQQVGVRLMNGCFELNDQLSGMTGMLWILEMQVWVVPHDTQVFSNQLFLSVLLLTAKFPIS